MPDYDVEMSEVLLYHVRVLEDLGEYTEALTLLDANAKSRAIIDRVAIQEFRGEPGTRMVSGPGYSRRLDHQHVSCRRRAKTRRNRHGRD